MRGYIDNIGGDTPFLHVDGSLPVLLVLPVDGPAFVPLAAALPPPVGVVHRGVFEQRSEDEDKTHDEVDIDGFDIADPGKGLPHPGGDRRHRQDSSDPWRMPHLLEEEERTYPRRRGHWWPRG